jgi:hypothetical protein
MKRCLIINDFALSFFLVVIKFELISVLKYFKILALWLTGLHKNTTNNFFLCFYISELYFRVADFTIKSIFLAFYYLNHSLKRTKLKLFVFRQQ